MNEYQENNQLETQENTDFVASLDIGTDKISLSIGKFHNGEFHTLLGSVTEKTKGVDKGKIINVELVSRDISSLKEEAEEILGYEVNEVVVGISDMDHSLHHNHAMVPVPERQISRRHLIAVNNAAKAIPLKPSEQIIHVLPESYLVDGTETSSPVGYTGVRLDVNATIITVPSSSIEKVQHVCANAGLLVREIIFSPLASSMAVTSNRERYLGTIIIDMGAGTTDVVIYRNGKLKYCDVLQIGGRFITNDLAEGLHCLQEEAEDFKLRFGKATSFFEEELTREDFEDTGEFVIWQDQKQMIVDIIEARVTELLELIFANMKQSDFTFDDSYQIVLTGGTALLPQMKELTSEIYELETRIGAPDIPHGVFDAAKSPIYSTAVGLLMTADKWDYTTSSPTQLHPQNKIENSQIFQKVISWFGGFFD
ncbi:MAG: cell division protein FtsA [Myxococcota bacterium]